MVTNGRMRDGDFLEVTRAIRDEVRDLVRQEHSRWNTEIGDRVAVAVEQAVGRKFQNLKDTFQADFKRLEDSHAKTLQAMLEAIKSLPVPVVNLPEVKPPTVNVAAPAVNVNVPKQEAPNVTVNVPEGKAPMVTVNVPEGKAPTVNVNVPKQETPVVNVTVPEQVVNVTTPEPKLTKKYITYDEKGRPVEITETDMLI